MSRSPGEHSLVWSIQFIMQTLCELKYSEQGSTKLGVLQNQVPHNNYSTFWLESITLQRTEANMGSEPLHHAWAQILNTQPKTLASSEKRNLPVNG